MDDKKFMEIHSAVMVAYTNFCKHQDFSQRAKTYIQEQLPGYTIYINNGKKDVLSLAEIAVWGKDIAYIDHFRVSFKTNGDKSWQENFLYQMELLNRLDSMEREEDEAMLSRAFTELEEEIKVLETQIAVKKHKALEFINKLPIPKHATVRKERRFWDQPSQNLMKKFPRLFKNE